jgi:hypothetical protein
LRDGLRARCWACRSPRASQNKLTVPMQWLEGIPRAKTRITRFAALAVAA